MSNMHISERSMYFPYMTLEQITSAPENRHFDRKSASIKPTQLGAPISAFANAEGGTIAIGINDKTLEIEGINHLGEERINALLMAPKEACKPMPAHHVEFINVINHKGKKDRLLLLHILPARGCLVRTNKDDTYLRMGDKSCLIKGDALNQLEFTRQLLRYEDTICELATMADLDPQLLHEYKQRIDAVHLTDEQVLHARGFMQDGKLTYGAVLLFAQNIRRLYPNCRVRFLRYDGDSQQPGIKLNLVKDHTIEEPLPRLISKSLDFISTQLRDFTALDPQTGKFKTASEYPEFAWQEGLINAITHREYALCGDFIRVSMYDDRLEIESPGKLPAPVTLNNITYTRYARNIAISRTLTELGWVRELNEGVKRIYADMEDFYLAPPQYSEPPDAASVKLVLYNNINVRQAYRAERISQQVGISHWDSLDELEKDILTYMGSVARVRTKELVALTGYANNTVSKRIRHLTALGLIRCHGLSTDPNRCYSLSDSQ